MIAPGKIELNRREWMARNRYVDVTTICALPPTARFRDEPLLKVRFIDVGHGDGAIIETPNAQIILWTAARRSKRTLAEYAVDRSSRP